MTGRRYFSKTRQTGFTLLEVLVALTMFAVVAVMINTRSASAMNNLARIKEKTFALWLAENKAAELRLKKQWPSVGNAIDSVDMAGREWYVDTDVLETPNKNLRRVVIRIYENDADEKDNSIVTLYTFVGKH